MPGPAQGSGGRAPPRELMCDAQMVTLEYMMETEVKRSGSCTVARDAMVVRNRPAMEPALPPEAMVMSMVLLLPGSVLMSEVHVTTKGHVDVPGLGYCLKPC